MEPGGVALPLGHCVNQVFKNHYYCNQLNCIVKYFYMCVFFFKVQRMLSLCIITIILCHNVIR